MLSRRESLLPPPGMRLYTGQNPVLIRAGPNGCLRGVFVALSNRVLAKRSLIIELCKRTGAIFIGAFAPKCTHLIHSGSVHEPAMSREMQAAQLAGKKIVHPAWLEAVKTLRVLGSTSKPLQYSAEIQININQRSNTHSIIIHLRAEQTLHPLLHLLFLL